MRLLYAVLTVLFCFFSLNSPVFSSEWQGVVGGDDATVLNNSHTGTVNTGQKEKGVGLVAVSVPEKGAIPIGTAWLYKPGVLATNAHVARDVAVLLKQATDKGVSGCVAYYLPNQSKGIAVQILAIAIHPEYNRIAVDVNGTRPANSPDVALMTLKEKLSPALSIAGKNVLENLKPGDAVQYIGFPMENLHGKNVNLHNVMATTQSGTITAISDWWFGDSGASANKLIRHDMGIAGGASGSPIFNRAGQVIGLVNAGNMLPNISFTKSGEKKVSRASNAVMVNFGIRVDLLDEIQFK